MESQKAAGEELMIALQALDHRLAAGLLEWVLNALKDFKTMMQSTRPIDEWSAKVQAFYESTHTLLTEDLEKRYGCAPVSKEQLQLLMEHVEKFIMRRIYAAVFSPADGPDRADDLSLLSRTRSLRWITAHHLDACIVEGDASVRESLKAACEDLWKLTSCKSPVEKLDCVVTCSGRVFEALHRSRMALGAAEEKPSSADDFLPAFIFVVIRASTPQLLSNINYVTRFGNPSYMSNGEQGYYFTSLCCATDFIRKLDAESLNLPVIEFSGYMTGSITPTAGGLTADAFACQGLSLMHENLFLMGELRQRQQRLHSRTDSLRSGLTSFRRAVYRRPSLPLPAVRGLCITEADVKIDGRSIQLPDAESTLISKDAVSTSAAPDSMAEASSPVDERRELLIHLPGPLQSISQSSSTIKLHSASPGSIASETAHSAVTE